MSERRMTATEKLCKILDERGVEYVLNDEYAEKYPPENEVTWSSDLAGEDMTVTARDYCISKDEDGRLEYCLDLEFHEVFTPEQAVAATLGGGKCIPHGEWKRISQTQEVRHVFCECGYELGMDERDSFPFERTRLFAMPNYCQECGRKIRKAVKR